MANKLEIWNRALAKLGERRVTSLTEDSPNRRKLEAVYNEDKRAVLSMHAWKFALKQANLATNVAAPIEGFKYSYELPNDFIRITALNDKYPEARNTPFFTIRGDRLHTDEEVAIIEYVHDVPEEGIMPPLFVEALSTYIAVTLSYSIQKSNSVLLSERFEMDLGRAKSVSGSGDRRPVAAYYAWPNLGARLGNYPR